MARTDETIRLMLMAVSAMVTIVTAGGIYSVYRAQKAWREVRGVERRAQEIAAVQASLAEKLQKCEEDLPRLETLLREAASLSDVEAHYQQLVALEALVLVMREGMNLCSDDSEKRTTANRALIALSGRSDPLIALFCIHVWEQWNQVDGEGITRLRELASSGSSHLGVRTRARQLLRQVGKDIADVTSPAS
jgi:hypothetical protein